MELVKEHEMMKNFELQSTTGQIMGPQDYREKKSLVLVFFETDCIGCSDFLEDMAERYDDYKAENAEILAVGEGTMEEVSRIANAMSLPFPVLADPDGHALKMYSDSIPALFIADRFGEIRLTISEKEEGEHFPNQQKILSRLDLAELECPECGAPTWTV